MAHTIDDLVSAFKYATQDSALRRWTLPEVVTWVNEAYIRTVTIRPDANAGRHTVSLALGPYQDLDDASSVNLAGAIKLIRVTRNISGGSSIIREIPEEELNFMLPDWPGDAAATSIERWARLGGSAREFVVYPPAQAGVTIELLTGDTPTLHTPGSATVTTDALSLRDEFMPALLDYVLHRAFTKDQDNPANAAKAQRHLQLYLAAMGAAPAAAQEG